ncbi:hypothetical protein FB45DRAFT_1017134 [Roridomyces roridus]|uniref:Uncharacterized protein n=1 Tax=Roridomyces roridus TaxID=1738132 RepID=A0AAD7CHX7_9AGAR|nr:hypothetical protein FB45DRAFT_1017134 [Roridomyces roridus]
MAAHNQPGGGMPPYPYYYYPYPPHFHPGAMQQQQQPMQQPPLPAHRTQFLLGMTDRLPPLTAEERAVAGMQQALDSGTFEIGSEGNANDVTGRKRRSTTFQVLVPTPGPAGALPTDATLTVNRDGLDPGDFLARIRANMEVGEDVPLGWRVSNEAKNTVRRLSTLADACEAVDTILKKIDSPNRRNEVMLKIVDTREKIKAVPAKAETKAPEAAYREELTIVKDKLRCQSSNHTFCYIPSSGPRVGQHIQLTMQDITFWARQMKNGSVPRDCSAAPNTLKTDEIITRHEERRQRTSRPGASVDSAPHTHFNLADTPLGQVWRPKRDDQERAVLGKRARSESPDDEPPIVPAADLLAHLDAKMPAVGFLGYQAALDKAEIRYCHQFLDFSEPELQAELNVGRAPAKDLIHGAKKILRVKKRQEVEEQEGEKENVPEEAGEA